MGQKLNMLGRVTKWGYNSFKTTFSSAGKFVNTRNPRYLQQAAKATLGLYGGATVATWGARAAAGKKPMQNAQGKRDILPFIPYI